jgi:hypothetical protein
MNGRISMDGTKCGWRVTGSERCFFQSPCFLQRCIMSLHGFTWFYMILHGFTIMSLHGFTICQASCKRAFFMNAMKQAENL